MTSKTIWKYNLPLQERQTLALPPGAEILTADVQDGGNLCLWALIDLPMTDDLPGVSRQFRIMGTGYVFDDAVPLRYIATVQASPYVWHIFEEA